MQKLTPAGCEAVPLGFPGRYSAGPTQSRPTYMIPLPVFWEFLFLASEFNPGNPGVGTEGQDACVLVPAALPSPELREGAILQSFLGGWGQ